ncbi:lipase/acyltransferase domain-containing protein [Lysinibacillus capsici]|uniref:lipase/acyltransferase domain-containing protein n=1 Tax=Lysinibacillus capsici TaxID=2115968 RepID=UPI0024802766|nr:hypothetical protein [Lysinibacillus capsici]
MKHILFLPGTMGSHLEEGNNLLGRPKRKWFSIMNKNAKRLALDDSNKNNRIIPGPPIENGITLVGNMVKDNIIYKQIIDELKNLKKEGYVFKRVGYDWRKNLLDENFSYLDNVISELKSEEIIIVAHSMGGLLTKAYTKLKKGNHNVKKVITIGTPWQGSPDSFNVLLNGVQDRGFFFPDIETTKYISRTFPSVFQLLPSEKYCNKFSYINDGGKNLTWSESFLKLYDLDDIYFKEGKNLNKELYDLIETDWDDSIDHHNIVGVKQGTLGTIPLGNSENENFSSVDGDETVPLYSALPPSSSRSKIYYAEASHMGLVKYKPVLELVKNIILDQPVAIEGITTQYLPKNDWTVLKVDCPVDVYYEKEEEDFNSHKKNMTKVFLGDTKYLIQNNEDEQTIEVEAYDEGSTQIEMLVTKKDKIISKYKFKTIEADPSRKALVKLEFNKNEKEFIPEVRLEPEKDSEKEIIIKGRNVPLDKKIASVPTTTLQLAAKGRKNIDDQYDEQGAVLSLSNKGEYVLDTFYKINNNNWRIFNQDVELLPEKDLEYGKNVIQYYSMDIFGNKERIRRKNIIINPILPKAKFKVKLIPDMPAQLEMESVYEGIKNYEFEYNVNNQKVKSLDKLSTGKAYKISYRIKDIFDRKTEWIDFDFNLIKLVDTLWKIDGYQGTFKELIDNSFPYKQEIPIIKIGNSQKGLNEKISNTAKYLSIQYSDIEFDIELVVKMDVYLHYHSEVIKKQDKPIEIKFSVFNVNGEQVSDFEPKVIYSYLPVKNENTDIVRPEVKKLNKGIYSFKIQTKFLTSDVKKIKIEFKETVNSTRSITTKMLILD